MKKTLSLGVGMALLLLPVAAFAQSTPTSTTTAFISQLQSLIQVLTQASSISQTVTVTSLETSIGTLISQLEQALTTSKNQPPTKGSLTAVSPSPISYLIVAGGTTDVTVGTFTLQPSGENMSLQNIGLALNSDYASSSDISRTYIYNSAGTQVGSVIFTGSPTGHFYYATSTITTGANIAQNVQSVYTIRTDINQIGTGQAGTLGDLLQVGLADAMAIGSTSRSVYQSGALAATGAGLRMFKSYPTVVTIPLSQTTYAVGSKVAVPLKKYSITANSDGPVGILRQTFSTAASGASITNTKLYAYTDPAFSQPMSGTSNGGQLGAAACATSCSGVSYSFGAGSNPIEIPAGQTVYFQVMGTVTPLNGASSVSVTTTLKGDTSYAFGTGSSLTASNFVWSPNSTTTSASTNLDWTNGYGVSGLPAIGISQSIIGIASTTPTVSGSPTTASATLANLASALTAAEAILQQLLAGK